MEYEADLIIRRFKPHNGSLLNHPDEVEVFRGIKVFSPEYANIFDIIEDYKYPAYNAISADQLELFHEAQVDEYTDKMDTAEMMLGRDSQDQFDQIHPPMPRNETNAQKFGI